MPHPSTSPDMNPIEKCWRWIKQALHRRKRQPTTEAENSKAGTLGSGINGATWVVYP
jgi:transposase